MDHVTRATPLSGTVGRPKANTRYSMQAHKICLSIDISEGVKFQNASRGPDSLLYRATVKLIHVIIANICWVLMDNTLRAFTQSHNFDHAHFSWPNRAQNLKSVALAVPKIFHGV